jgi:hypothetical protein
MTLIKVFVKIEVLASGPPSHDDFTQRAGRKA